MYQVYAIHSQLSIAICDSYSPGPIYLRLWKWNEWRNWHLSRLSFTQKKQQSTKNMTKCLRSEHRIEINQKSDSSENFVKTGPLFFNAHVQNTSSIRHFDTILTSSWQVPPALLTTKRHLPVTKADVVLTFCTYKVLYTKKAGGKNCRGN